MKETSITTLNDNGWELVDEVVKNNIIKIQSFRTKLDPYIRVGIATLRDKIYILDGFDEEKNMYYKWMNHTKIYIEPDITIPYIKISQYKNEKNLKRIIFPYIIENNNSIPIQPKEMKTKYPMAFQYFKSVKDDLKDRATEKKVNAEMWYLYGRSQGLNLWNNKILFSTFNENPDFFLCENNKVLFSNGYCITNFDLDEEVLLKIINSKIMKYFIDNISYSISGNYKCYQKKYVKNFSIPDLSHKDIIFLKTCNNRNEIDDYLIRLYDLKNI